MYILIFVLLLVGLVFNEIISPIAVWLLDNMIIIGCVFIITFIIYSFYYGKKQNSIGAGIGAFLAVSQFWFFVFVAVLSIAEMVNKEDDVVMSAIIALIVGVISFVYASFNYKMLVTAGEEAEDNPIYYIAVGIVGWIVNAIVLF